jgi:hypothetical protein
MLLIHFENIIVLPEVSFFSLQINLIKPNLYFLDIGRYFYEFNIWEYFCFLGYYDAFSLIYSRFLDKKSIFNGFHLRNWQI